MKSIGQYWTDSITANDSHKAKEEVQPVVTNESVVSQVTNDYKNYKKGILDNIKSGGQVSDEQQTFN